MHAARNLLMQALSLKPESPLNCNNLAWILATGPSPVRDANQAETLARSAMASDPEQAMYLNTLGVALFRTGKYGEAIETLEKSLSRGERFNQPYDLLFLAMCHAQAGDLEKARQYQNRATQVIAEQASGQSKLWHDELFEFNQEAIAILARCESAAQDMSSKSD